MSYLKSICTLIVFTFFASNAFAQLADVNEGCATLEVAFTAPSGSTFFWTFGDGGTSADRNPRYNYTTPGIFTAEFRNTQGGAVIATETISVYSVPEINFTGNPVGGCVPLTTTLINTSTIDPNIIPTITNISWTFGDSESGTGSPITHTYDRPGAFDVSLSLESSLPGCDAGAQVDSFITTSNLAASFTVDSPSACVGPLTVNFTNTTDDPDDNLTYTWDFDNGNTSNQRDPQAQTYTDVQSYTVSLTVRNAEGCEVTTTQIINIGSPTVDFNIADTICAGNTINIENISSVGSYQWDFGPNATPQTSTLRNPSVTFSTSGNQDITLTVTDLSPAACTNTITKTIFTDLIVADFVVDPVFSCDLPQEFTFTLNDLTVDSVEWNFPMDMTSNDITAVFTVPADTSVFGRNGEQTFTVSNRVFNSRGCSDEFNTTFSVHAPNALFTVDTTMGCAPLTVTFFDSLSTAHENIVSYTFVWGDGTANTTTTNDAPVTHTYNTDGDFEPFLIIENASGCTDTSFSIPIFVGAPVTADFTADETTICPGDTVTFMGTGDANIDAWHFDADGGRLSHCADDANPSWVFNSNTGTMDVDLIVLYNGCPTTVSRPDFITVNGPLAEIDYSIDCEAPFDVLFENLSQDATDGKWFFGNGDSSLLLNPTFTYPETGDFQVILESTNDMSGCPTSFDTMTVSIRDIQANFELPETVCIGNEIPLDASMSTDVNATCWKGYTWFFPSLQRPITTQDSIIMFSFGSNGEHDVELVVDDINGCRDTIRDTILVIQALGDFIADPIRLCAPNSVSFTDLSVPISDTTIVEWMWDFGDGNQDSTNQNPTHIYTETPPNGSYTVMLTVTDVLNCEGMASLNIDFYEPQSTITVNGDRFCVGDVLEFSASDFTSEGSFLTYVWTFNGQEISRDQASQIDLNNAGDFTLEVTYTEDATGCQNTSSIQINVQDFPSAEFMSDGNDDGSPTCAGQVFFDNIGNNPGGITYRWDLDGDGFLETQTSDLQVSDFFESESLTITHVASTTNGCTDTLRRDYTFVQPDGRLIADASTACVGEEIIFTITDTVDVNDFRIDFGDGTIIENTSPVSHIFTSGGSFRVLLILEQNLGNEVCSAEAIVDVEIEDLNISIAGPTQVCEGDDIILGVQGDVQPTWTFNWVNGAGNPIGQSPTIPVVPLQSQTYSVTVTNPATGCTDSESIAVAVVPDLDGIGDTRTRLVLSSDETGVPLPPLPTTLDDRNDITVTWTGGQLNTDNPLAPITTMAIGDRDSIVFTGTVIAGPGCDTLTFIRILRPVRVPNIFAPGTGGPNAFFNIIGDNIDLDDIESIRVFNRWGQKVYDNETPGTGWNGMFNGENQPPDVYVWIVEVSLDDGTTETLTGDVTLVR